MIEFEWVVVETEKNLSKQDIRVMLLHENLHYLKGFTVHEGRLGLGGVNQVSGVWTHQYGLEVGQNIDTTIAFIVIHYQYINTNYRSFIT